MSIQYTVSFKSYVGTILHGSMKKAIYLKGSAKKNGYSRFYTKAMKLKRLIIVFVLLVCVDLFKNAVEFYDNPIKEQLHL